MWIVQYISSKCIVMWGFFSPREFTCKEMSLLLILIKGIWKLKQYPIFFLQGWLTIISYKLIQSSLLWKDRVCLQFLQSRFTNDLVSYTKVSIFMAPHPNVIMKTGSIQRLLSIILDNGKHKKIPNMVFMIQAHIGNSSLKIFTCFSF